MALIHLTDTELQDYLDGNLTPKQIIIITQHLEQCSSCRNALSTYQQIYYGLEKEMDIHLSTNFAKTVMEQLPREATTIFSISVQDILLSILGLLLAVGTTLYFVDIEPLVLQFIDTLNPKNYFNPSSLAHLKDFVSGLTSHFPLIGFAGLVLLIMIAIDHLVFRRKSGIMTGSNLLTI